MRHINKKIRLERLKDQSCRIWKEKIDKLSKLESDIQALLMEFMDDTGVTVSDIQLYDPKTGEVQLETDL